MSLAFWKVIINISAIRTKRNVQAKMTPKTFLIESLDAYNTDHSKFMLQQIMNRITRISFTRVKVFSSLLLLLFIIQRD